MTIEALIIGLQDIDDSSGEYSGAISQECIIEAIPEIFSRADVRIYTEMVEYFLEIIERGKIQ